MFVCLTGFRAALTKSNSINSSADTKPFSHLICVCVCVCYHQSSYQQLKLLSSMWPAFLYNTRMAKRGWELQCKPNSHFMGIMGLMLSTSVFRSPLVLSCSRHMLPFKSPIKPHLFLTYVSVCDIIINLTWDITLWDNYYMNVVLILSELLVKNVIFIMKRLFDHKRR